MSIFGDLNDKLTRCLALLDGVDEADLFDFILYFPGVQQAIVHRPDVVKDWLNDSMKNFYRSRNKPEKDIYIDIKEYKIIISVTEYESGNIDIDMIDVIFNGEIWTRYAFCDEKIISEARCPLQVVVSVLKQLTRRRDYSGSPC
jgi:hypothetical protein